MSVEQGFRHINKTTLAKQSNIYFLNISLILVEFKLPVISFSYNVLVIILNKLNHSLRNVTIIT